jgi:hypothetical protein
MAVSCVDREEIDATGLESWPILSEEWLDDPDPTDDDDDVDSRTREELGDSDSEFPGFVSGDIFD